MATGEALKQEQVKETGKLPVQPMQPWQIVAMLFMFVSFVEGFVVSHLVSSFLPLYLAQLGVAKSDILRLTGLVTPLTFLVGLPLVPFWGVWAERYGRKLIIARTALVEMLVFSGVAISQNVWQLAGAVALAGLQLGNSGIMLAALRSVTPPKRVGLAISLLGLAGPLGFAIGPALGGYLLNQHLLTLRGLYFLDAAISLFSAGVITVVLRERKREVKVEGNVLGAVGVALRGIAGNKLTVLIFAIGSLLNFAQITSRAYLPVLVQRAVPDPNEQAAAIGLVVGTAALVGTLLSPISGVLGDRFGYRVVLGAGLLAVTTCLFILPFAAGTLALAGLSGLTSGAGSACSAMVFSLLATETPEEQRGNTLNLAYIPLYLGGIAGPIFAATIAGFGLTAILLLCATMAAVTLLLWTRLRRGTSSAARQPA